MTDPERVTDDQAMTALMAARDQARLLLYLKSARQADRRLLARVLGLERAAFDALITRLLHDGYVQARGPGEAGPVAITLSGERRLEAHFEALAKIISSS